MDIRKDGAEHTNEDREMNANRAPQTGEENVENAGPETEGLMDLDGDGFIGNTGGFYGGTSYLGSNYGEDWNNDANTAGNEGNFGAAGQQDSTDNTGRNPDQNNEDRLSTDRERS